MSSTLSGNEPSGSEQPPKKGDGQRGVRCFRKFVLYSLALEVQTKMMRFQGSWLLVAGVVTVVTALGCKEPAAATAPLEEPKGSGLGNGNGGRPPYGAEPKPEPEPTRPSAQVSSVSDPDWLAVGDGDSGGGAGSGSGGTVSQAVVPPFGDSTECGDSIVGGNEECDDGDEGSDACTAECQTRDQAVVALDGPRAADRYLGDGRHPIAGQSSGFVTTYAEVGDDEPAVFATLFDIWGRRTREVMVSEGGAPLDAANPVVAALPDSSYVVAWSDFDGDGSEVGVALRRLDAHGALGSLRSANAGAEFSQLNPDMVWTGSELVVAWEDYSDPLTGPDLRYRTFDGQLNPKSGDSNLATSELPEAAVALATFGGTWAAAYREGTANGLENVVVKVGSREFRVEPFPGGPIDDRPTLAALDASHWLVAFSVGTDPTGSGVSNVSRIRYAVVDTAAGSPATLASFALDPLDDTYTFDTQVSQLEPVAEASNEGVYLAWRTEARPGDGAGDQLWLKPLRWRTPAVGGATALDLEAPEILIPRTCEASSGDQRRPALANVPLPPSHALAMAWDDYSRSQGPSAGEPAVVMQYSPLPVTDTSSPEVFTETWTMPSGNAWPARWNVETSGANASYGVLNNKGRFVQGTGTDGAGKAYVKVHSALNIDVVTSVYMFASVTSAGVFVRQNQAGTSWLGAQVAAKTNDKWRIYAQIDGTFTDLVSMPMPTNFPLSGVGYEYRLRFRVTTAADGSVFLGMKYWSTGAPEPSDWLLQTTQAPGSAVASTFAAAGRFGVTANLNTTNRKVVFDDFRAAFFEGNQLGDPTASPRDAAPLRRAPASYRPCRPGQACGVGEGCCFANADCSAGLACASGHGQFLGLGSHANTCVPDHCHNLKLDAGEVRADCGGPDCAPCSCTSSVAPDTSQYCTDACSCGIGEGQCEYNECLPGLACGVDNARQFGTTNTAFEACAPLHCFDRVQDGDETVKDCGGSCGSNCSCEPSNGVFFHCRVFCPCALGHGPCWFNDECGPGLVCGPGKGLAYGLGGGTACTPPHCTNTVLEPALGETARDCGGECGACP